MLCLALLLCGAARAQQPVRIVLFDEDDPAGAGYYDASFGVASGGDQLSLFGPEQNKLPVSTARALTGQHSGLLFFRHQTGSWEMFVARPGWEPVDLSRLDSLVLFLTSSTAVPGEELPRIGLEDAEKRKSALVPLSAYLPGLDADPESWQRVAVPLADFAPEGGFDRATTQSVRFAAGGVNPAPRLIWLDAVQAVGTLDGVTAPAAPAGLLTRPGDGSVILRWTPVPDASVTGYDVYRAADGGPPERLTPVPVRTPHFADPLLENGRRYTYHVRAVNALGVSGEASQPASATPAALDEEGFLELLQRTAFDYFWYEANPSNGLVRDRSRPGSAASIAAVGFGLSAITVGIDRGWITRDEGRARVLTTLRTFWEGPQGPAASGTIGYRGFFYHFLNMETATRAGTTELSTIDTALLLGGVLHAKAYFDGTGAEEQLRALADSIYRRVEWDWAQARPPLIGHGWRPESGHIAFDWVGYNEAMLLYLLALGSPTHPVGPEAWDAWTAGYEPQWQTHYGHTFLTFPPLFGHQYSHVWIDFRGIRDAYMRGKGLDYFENSRRATLAQQAYAVDNPGRWKDYGPLAWGLTASDVPTGYRARGAPPAQNDDGTITPTAPGGSVPFAPDETIATLRHLYDTYRARLWSAYGFRDAFNPTANWYGQDVLGIDQGPILLMIENHRTGRVWDAMRQDEDLRRGLERAGFRPAAGTATEPPAATAAGMWLEAVYPDPFRRTLTLRVRLERPERVTATLYDLLGREAARLSDEHRPAGEATLRLDAGDLPAGSYLLVVRAGNATATRMLVRP